MGSSFARRNVVATLAVVRNVVARLPHLTFHFQGREDKYTIGQILHINIPTPQGYLEGILKPEEQGETPKFTGLVCHPHPLGGGTMHTRWSSRQRKHCRRYISPRSVSTFAA